VRVLGGEIGKPQGRSSHDEVGENGQGVQEDLAHQAVGEMPEIMGPDAFEMRSLDQLTKDLVNAIAPAREVPAQAWPRVVGPTTERSQEGQPVACQFFPQLR
jgi:hypothetical protein